jgi:hypothetical protein
MTIKSRSLVILKIEISGSEIITLGFPPASINLASISPKVQVTLNLPG